jgi:hypothetical protein
MREPLIQYHIDVYEWDEAKISEIVERGDIASLHYRLNTENHIKWLTERYRVYTVIQGKTVYPPIPPDYWFCVGVR